MNSSEFQQHAERVEQALQSANELADEGARNTALALMQSLMDLHGTVLARMLEVMNESGDAARSLLEKLGRDPLVCGLLVLYGMHPLPLEQRVAQALERLQPRLRKRQASAKLVAIESDRIRVRIEAAGENSGSTDGLRTLVEQAVREAAPEAGEVVVEGALDRSGFVPIEMLQPAMKGEEYEEPAA
jgi:hypothetical protein